MLLTYNEAVVTFNNRLKLEFHGSKLTPALLPVQIPWALLALLPLLLFSSVETLKADSFTNTGAMNTSRYDHTATLLPNGLVMAAGGLHPMKMRFVEDPVPISSVELYHFSSGTWSNTGAMNTSRFEHTATLLTNGQVLVAGGADTNASLSSAELYDPAIASWTITGSMNNARSSHTATLLTNGQVLVAGGDVIGTSAELYDPATAMWTNTGSMNDARFFHTATLLPNGQVLVAGGADTNGSLSSAELYDPATATWTNTASMHFARSSHTATLLTNGQVLVAGGADTNGSLSSAELYDPATATWTITAPLNNARQSHTATLLPNGQVLVAGGDAIGTSAELFNPATGAWANTGSMNYARYSHTATLLPTGRPMVAGGAQPQIQAAGSASYSRQRGDLHCRRHHSRCVWLGRGFRGSNKSSAQCVECRGHRRWRRLWLLPRR